MSDSVVQRPVQELQVPEPLQEHRERDEGCPEHGECRAGEPEWPRQGGQHRPGGHPDHWR